MQKFVVMRCASNVSIRSIGVASEFPRFCSVCRRRRRCRVDAAVAERLARYFTPVAESRPATLCRANRSKGNATPPTPPTLAARKTTPDPVAAMKHSHFSYVVTTFKTTVRSAKIKYQDNYILLIHCLVYRRRLLVKPLLTLPKLIE